VWSICQGLPLLLVCQEIFPSSFLLAFQSSADLSLFQNCLHCSRSRYLPPQFLKPIFFRSFSAQVTLTQVFLHVGGSGYLSRYSDSLWGGRSGNWIPVETRNSALVHIGPGAHPTSYTMGTGSFPGVKRPGRGVDHPPHLAPRLRKE
jgi:hypothetical protein